MDGHALNPRHSYGSWLFVNNCGLMEKDGEGRWQPTEKGESFLRGDDATLREFDEGEGLLKLLELLAGFERAKRGDILPEWTEYLHQVSNFASEQSCKVTLHQRLTNLVARGLVSREGNCYQVSEQGLTWLERSHMEVVQVKRIQGTITRPTVDQLRGALPYHKAIRGTLITLGRFFSSCSEAALFPWAAPITLIDGDRLIEMLIENGFDMRKSKAIELLEIDTSAFDLAVVGGTRWHEGWVNNTCTTLRYAPDVASQDDRGPQLGQHWREHHRRTGFVGLAAAVQVIGAGLLDGITSVSPSVRYVAFWYR